jgi:hypothetical protein
MDRTDHKKLDSAYNAHRARLVKALSEIPEHLVPIDEAQKTSTHWGFAGTMKHWVRNAEEMLRQVKETADKCSERKDA